MFSEKIGEQLLNDWENDLKFHGQLPYVDEGKLRVVLPHYVVGQGIL